MEDNKKVSWNFGEGLIIELTRLLQIASNNYVGMRYTPWYQTLRAIKMRVTPKFNSKERKQLKDIESKMIDITNGTLRKTNQNSSSYILIAESYNELILDLMRKYGFYPKDLEDHTKIN